jgi:hypothetical protein
MAGAFSNHGHLETGTSMRPNQGNTAHVHPSLRQWMNNHPNRFGQVHHGNCAEVNTMSNYLWARDPHGAHTDQEWARQQLDGGRMTSHWANPIPPSRPGHREVAVGDYAEPCRNCQPLLQGLGVTAVRTPDHPHSIVGFGNYTGQEPESGHGGGRRRPNSSVVLGGDDAAVAEGHIGSSSVDGRHDAGTSVESVVLRDASGAERGRLFPPPGWGDKEIGVVREAFRSGAADARLAGGYSVVAHRGESGALLTRGPDGAVPVDEAGLGRLVVSSGAKTGDAWRQSRGVVLLTCDLNADGVSNFGDVLRENGFTGKVPDAVRGPVELFADGAVTEHGGRGHGTAPVRAGSSVKLGGAGASASVADRPHRTVPGIQPDDVRWLRLKDSSGRHIGMALASRARLDQDVKDLFRDASDYSVRAVRQEFRDSSGEVQKRDVLPAWADATQGARHRPFYLLLDGDEHGIDVPLVDGSSVRVPPSAFADMLMGTTQFWKTLGNNQRPLLVFTEGPRKDGPDSPSAQVGRRLDERTGPWWIHHYAGPHSFDVGPVLNLPEGAKPHVGAAPAASRLRHVQWDHLTDFPSADRSAPTPDVRDRMLDLSDAARRGLRDLGVRTGGSRPLVLHVDSPDGTFARLATNDMDAIDFGGKQLAEAWLSLPGIQRQLADDPNRKVVLLASGAGGRANFGGLGFDFSSALRERGIFTDVYALDGRVEIDRDAIRLPDGATLVPMSGLRSGDVHTTV